MRAIFASFIALLFIPTLGFNAISRSSNGSKIGTNASPQWIAAVQTDAARGIQRRILREFFGITRRLSCTCSLDDSVKNTPNWGDCSKSVASIVRLQLTVRTTTSLPRFTENFPSFVTAVYTIRPVFRKRSIS